MQKRLKLTLIIGLIPLLIFSACSTTTSTRNWQTFTIEEAPGFDIQLRIPSDWAANYDPPTDDNPGQWNVVITPPECSLETGTTFADNCINLTAYVKGEAEFDKDELLTYISESISLNEQGTVRTILMDRESIEGDGLTIQRYNHKITNPEREIQMSIFYLETDGAYYVFIYSVPYEQRDGNVATAFRQVLETIEMIN
jgi:hypothetical protein